MYREDGNLIISPSDVVVFLESEFASWMDRWLVGEYKSGPVIPSAADKLQPTPDQADLQTLLFAKKGMQHEIAFLDDLKQQGKQIVEIGRDNSPFDTTIAAMREGRDFIYLQSGSEKGPFKN